MPLAPLDFTIHPATSADIPVLRDLIEASVRGLQSKDYSPSQIDSALATVFGVDTQLIADGTYFVAENVGATAPVVQGAPPDPLIVGPPDQVYEQSERSWSRRRDGFPLNPPAGRPELCLDKRDDGER